jgi:hypothetical protein
VARATSPRRPPTRGADPAVLASTAARFAARTETMGLSNWIWGEGVAP